MFPLHPPCLKVAERTAWLSRSCLHYLRCVFTNSLDVNLWIRYFKMSSLKGFNNSSFSTWERIPLSSQAARTHMWVKVEWRTLLLHQSVAKWCLQETKCIEQEIKKNKKTLGLWSPLVLICGSAKIIKANSKMTHRVKHGGFFFHVINLWNGIKWRRTWFLKLASPHKSGYLMSPNALMRHSWSTDQLKSSKCH